MTVSACTSCRITSSAGWPRSLAPKAWTLQLVLDQGAWEEVPTLDSDDADVLQELLRHARDVYFDIGRRVLMFGTTAVGS